MIQGKTSSGFEFSLDDNALDDYELLEVICQVDKGDYGMVTEMVNKLLGESQKEELKNHIRNDHGKVSAKLMLEEVMEIFQGCNEGKNF